MSYDPTTDAGRVRLLISDTAPVDEDQFFTDVEIVTFLALEDNDVRLAAAQALDTIASNEVLVAKVIKTLDLQTDGAKAAAELRARAKGLRDQSTVASDDEDDAFDVIEVALPVFGDREVLDNSILRS